MNKQLKFVEGSECLNWIDKPIGLINGGFDWHNIQDILSHSELVMSHDHNVGVGTNISMSIKINTHINVFKHDLTKRKVGVILDEYDDGGLLVAILGNENINKNGTYNQQLHVVLNKAYKYDLIKLMYVADGVFDSMPQYSLSAFYEENQTAFILYKDRQGHFYPYDEIINYYPEIIIHDNTAMDSYWAITNKNNLTNDINTTLHYGVGALEGDFSIHPLAMNPIKFLCGNLFLPAIDIGTDFYASQPNEAPEYYWNNVIPYYSGEDIHTSNLMSIPYNVILTHNEAWARSYLSSGTLPPDARLYPIDWDALDPYTPPDDDGSDGTDDNISDDNSRLVTPNPIQKPSFTPSVLSNYNWYWLQVGQFSNFLNWFWNEIGEIQDIGDILNKIEGLYNNLGSTILLCRYMPVNINWIGGVGAQEHIKLGMLEYSELSVDTIAKSVPDPILIGHIKIDEKYKSFVDLAPYSELMIYLPYHGYVDLDIDILNGHELYVYGVYDHMSGTLQYFLYYDDQFLINTFLAKIAVDIPLTLQSKNDRDSAVFSNVTNAVSGLIGAGTAIANGNPIGLVVGANALNSGANSAPINVKGTIGEQGAFYAPSQCAIILRRATISKPDTFSSNVGQMCGKSYTLRNLSGLTIVYNPRIKFNGNSHENVKSLPFDEEITEIYELLESGVIL